MKTISILAAFLAAVPLHAQEAAKLDEAEARRRAADARVKVAVILASVDGVRNIAMGGSGVEYRLLIAVEDSVTQANARQALGGDAFEGVPILWSVARPTIAVAREIPASSGPAAQAAKEPHRPAPTYPDWRSSIPDCDILLAHYGVKPPSRWKEGFKCEFRQRSVIPMMGPGGWTYQYTRHRPLCPVRSGTAPMPPNADNFVKWVYHKGYTDVARGGFLAPLELKGSDAAWAAWAEADLRSRLPYINGYAEWNRPGMSTRGHQRAINRGYTATPGAEMHWTTPDGKPPGQPGPPTPTPRGK